MEYERTMEISTRQMSSLFGSNDSHIRQIEDDLSVNVVDRDGMLHIKGEQPDKVDDEFIEEERKRAEKLQKQFENMMSYTGRERIDED